MRRRDGAMHWGLYSDLSDPERHVESFVVPSWSEHMRVATRMTASDESAIERIRSLHLGEEEPRLVAMLAHDLNGGRRPAAGLLGRLRHPRRSPAPR